MNKYAVIFLSLYWLFFLGGCVSLNDMVSGSNVDPLNGSILYPSKTSFKEITSKPVLNRYETIAFDKSVKKMQLIVFGKDFQNNFP